MARVPVVDAAYRDQVQEASTRISKLIESHVSLAPLFLKLSFHGEMALYRQLAGLGSSWACTSHRTPAHADALTFDKGSRTGGANGSVTTERELNEHAANKGLARAVDELQQIRAGPCPQLTIPGL